MGDCGDSELAFVPSRCHCSLVLRAEVKGHRLLLTGHPQTEEQAAILAAIGALGLRADILKVPHHGSAKQSPGFLDAGTPLGGRG